MVSDYKEREFGENMILTDELKLLTRGIVIVDKEGVIQYEYVPEVTHEANSKLSKKLKISLNSIANRKDFYGI